ncbi:MAG: V-type ATP synthase subunit I [Eubacterium sp.]|nr:V-type ATP synthase subunit I [Eubacterium sp.]
MAVLEMRKVIICAMKENRKGILELIQRKGVLEIREDLLQKNEELEQYLSKINTATQVSIFEKNAALAENALEILQELFPEETSLLSSLEGKKLLESEEYYQIVEKQQDLMGRVNNIISLKKQIDEKKADILKFQDEIKTLKPWEEMDVAMNYTGTRNTFHQVGCISGSYDNEGLIRKMEEMEAPERLSAQVVHQDKYQTYISCFYMKEEQDEVEQFLRKLNFTKPPVVAHHIPEKSIFNREDRIKNTEKVIDELMAQVEAETAHRFDFKKLSDYYRTRGAKYKVLGDLEQSKHTFIITGYMPENEVEELRKELEESYSLFFETEEIPESETAPVLIKNNGFTDAVEGVVKSFALPTKKEIDPTAITAFFYYFLFGIMLSDAAYGFLMFIGCLILLKKFPRMEEGMRKTFKMFMYCGISTLIWGVLFGGYFGNAISVISGTFFGKTVTIPPLWFEPVTQPMKMLVYCMVFGIVHLFTGLGIKGYLLLKDKDVTGFIFDVLMWYFFLAGLILMLIPTSIFASFIGGMVTFPAWLNLLAKGLTIVGMLGILLMAGRRAKNPAKRMMLGAYSLYDTTSWLSDLLSYSRLLALGLATGVIAQVINTMAAMGGRTVPGVILFIAVFLFGHIFNMAINLLGAYVHTNRLQFVEFFGKFYEGGGVEFQPFQTNTKYTDFDDVQAKRV